MSDRLCFWDILIRLVTGCSWVTAEALLDYQVSDTTLRARRDEWVAAGVFDRLRDHALHAYDRIVGLDLSEVAIDGSLHKAPCGGEGTGKNPTDRGKIGWKWSIATDAKGIPIGWAIDGANRNDVKLLEPTLEDADRSRLLRDVETVHLDRGYDYPAIRTQLHHAGLIDLNIQHRRLPDEEQPAKQPPPTGAAVGRRGHQLVVLQLRPTPSKHRPTHEPPPRTALSGDRPVDHGKIDRLAEPMEPRLTPYPLMP